MALAHNGGGHLTPVQSATNPPASCPSHRYTKSKVRRGAAAVSMSLGHMSVVASLCRMANLQFS